MDFTVRKIDKYIVKKFLLTFFIALLLIIGIVILFDVSEKIDKFVTNHAPLKAIFLDYYLNFIPYFINMFSPLFVFIAVIFFTSRMAANSEFIAMLSGGISYKRILVPYCVSAVFIALISLGLNLYVIPRSNVRRVEFEQKYTKTRRGNELNNVHYQISPGQFVYLQSFSKWNKTGYNFTIENIENDRLTRKVSAETAVWDTVEQRWQLRRVFIREYSEGLADKVTFKDQIDTTIDLTLKDLTNNKNTVETLPIKSLQELIDTQKMRGDANVMYAKIEKQRRYAMPFACIILTIIGVCISSRKKRGGIGWNLGLGIALAFSYILFLKFSEMFVYTNTLPPGVALWLPNFIFAIVAGVLYKYAQK